MCARNKDIKDGKTSQWLGSNEGQKKLVDIFAWEKTSFAEKSCVAELYPDKDTKSHVSLKKNMRSWSYWRVNFKRTNSQYSVELVLLFPDVWKLGNHPQLLVSGILEYQGYIRRFQSHHLSRPQTYIQFVGWLEKNRVVEKMLGIHSSKKMEGFM